MVAGLATRDERSLRVIVAVRSLYFDIWSFIGLIKHDQCDSAALLADARGILGLTMEPLFAHAYAELVVPLKNLVALGQGRFGNFAY